MDNGDDVIATREGFGQQPKGWEKSSLCSG